MLLLAALGVLMLARPASAAETPPNPKLSKAERALIEAVACGPGGCPLDCDKTDRRDRLLGLFTGYFDGGSRLEAFASLRPCRDGSVGGNERYTVFFHHDGRQWLREDDGGDHILEQAGCQVVRDGDRDVVICQSKIYGGPVETEISSLAREHGTRVAFALSIFEGDPLNCPNNVAESAEGTGLQIHHRPGGETTVDVQVTAQWLKSTPKAAHEPDIDDDCFRAFMRLSGIKPGAKHVNGYHEATRVLSIPLHDHQLRVTPALKQAVQRLNSHNVRIEDP
jgi:hypothetical protein